MVQDVLNSSVKWHTEGETEQPRTTEWWHESKLHNNIQLLHASGPLVLRWWYIFTFSGNVMAGMLTVGLCWLQHNTGCGIAQRLNRLNPARRVPIRNVQMMKTVYVTFMCYCCPNGPELQNCFKPQQSVFKNTAPEFHGVIFVQPLVVWLFQLHAFRTFLMELLHRLALINKPEETALHAHPFYFVFVCLVFAWLEHKNTSVSRHQIPPTPKSCHALKHSRTAQFSWQFPSRTSYLLRWRVSESKARDHKRKLQTWIKAKPGLKSVYNGESPLQEYF